MEFLEKYKKLFAVLGFVGFVVLMAFLLYSAFFKPMTSPEPGIDPTATSTTGSGQGLPAAGGRQPISISTSTEGSLTPETPKTGQEDKAKIDEVAEGGITKVATVSDYPSMGLSKSADGSGTRFYNENDGKFYKADQSGNLVELSDKVFHNVEQVTWSPSTNRAVLEFPDGANIVYDFDKQKSVTLPKHWEDFNFSQTGDKLSLKSYGLDPENRFLAIANYDGSEAKIIEKMGENGDRVFPSWSPNGQSVALYTEGVDFNRQEVYFVGQNKENFKSMVIDGRGFEFQWAPKGDKLMYSAYSENSDLKPTLWVANAQGDSIGSGRQKLNVDTWADKCTFSDQYTMYCGVPTSLERGAGLIEEMKNKTTDEIYQIDISSGAKKLVAIPDTAVNVSNMTVAGDGKYLYFTDNFSQKVQRITLK